MNMNDLFKELYEEKFGHQITKPLAESIVEDFAVTDGQARASGEKWTYEETISAGDKIGVDWNKVNKCEWYIVMNNMYSDYYRTAKKHGLSEGFYADLAYDWFYDVDADSQKTFDYFIKL